MRLAGWPRRLLALSCLLLAALSALGATRRAGSGASVVVLVAARPIAAGRALVAADLRLIDWPAARVPTGVIRRIDSVLGRYVAGPVASGELLTEQRFVGSSLATGLAGDVVAATVPLADPAAAQIVHVGDHVDLLPAPDTAGPEPDGSPPTPVTTAILRDVLVLAVLAQPTGPAPTSATVVVAVDRSQEGRLATFAQRGVFAMIDVPP